MTNEGSTEQSMATSALSAEDLLTRLLGLLSDAHDLDAISPDRVQAAVLPLTQRGGGFSSYGRLTADWTYDLEVKTESAVGPGLWLRFLEVDEAAHPPMTDISKIDLDQFCTALQEAGYDKSEKVGEHGRRMGYTLTRPPLIVEVEGRGESADNAGHACVSAVFVRGLEQR